ncbi:cytochrome P450 monooxygenase 3A17 [Fusarium denticulatum]|uniref:Cytochrome P450 monooxygenase 3A17 n=1 Tax=Fusarium denticulatum TaxID=48507 RepID=A0A8H5SZD3_9HYPO|nr:cytochrome P450 monooxygenase 3A17 [Fusarium denticulatum]
MSSATTADHRRMRKQLAPAFSRASLNEQEASLARHISLLVKCLTERADEEIPINVVDWFNFITIDFIGELTVSESFHCLENNDYHPWIHSIFAGIRGVALNRVLGYFEPLRILVKWTKINRDVAADEGVRQFARQLTQNRLSYGDRKINACNDITTFMLKKTSDGRERMSSQEIITTTPVLVISGSETTAAALSGLWFYLLQDAERHQVVCEEIRTRYDSEKSITFQNTAELMYLNACIE